MNSALAELSSLRSQVAWANLRHGPSFREQSRQALHLSCRLSSNQKGRSRCQVHSALDHCRLHCRKKPLDSAAAASFDGAGKQDGSCGSHSPAPPSMQQESGLQPVAPAAPAGSKAGPPTADATFVPGQDLPGTMALPQPLSILQYHADDPEAPDAVPETTYYILGTAHLSVQSCRDAAALIRAVKPQVVFLELCRERTAMLVPEFLPAQPSLTDVLHSVRSGAIPPFAAAYSCLLSRAGKELNVRPGEEFRVALQEAKAAGALVVLGDRPVSITMARMWAALSPWEKVRLLCFLLFASISVWDEGMRQEIERMKDSDALTVLVRQFGKAYPSLGRTLVTERDAYLTLMLRKLAGRATTVVAVVGAGHLQGIRENWDKEIDLNELISLPHPSPPPPTWSRIGIPVAVLLGAAAVVWLLLARLVC